MISLTLSPFDDAKLPCNPNIKIFRNNAVFYVFLQPFHQASCEEESKESFQLL
jgi:hypothetical protein